MRSLRRHGAYLLACHALVTASVANAQTPTAPDPTGTDRSVGEPSTAPMSLPPPEPVMSEAVPPSSPPSPPPEPSPATKTLATPVDPLTSASSFDDLDAVVAEAGGPAPASPRTVAAAPSASGSSASAMNPAISAILDVAAAYFSDDDPLQSGHHDPKQTGFNWQGLELALNGNVDPYLRFDANLCFGPEHAGLEEAFGTTLSLPAGLQLRLASSSRASGASAPPIRTCGTSPISPSCWGGSSRRGASGIGAEVSMVLPRPERRTRRLD